MKVTYDIFSQQSKNLQAFHSIAYRFAATSGTFSLSLLYDYGHNFMLNYFDNIFFSIKSL